MAALVGQFAAGLIDEDAARGFRSSPEEVGPAIPVRSLVAAHEPQVCLVDQRGGLESLTRGASAAMRAAARLRSSA